MDEIDWNEKLFDHFSFVHDGRRLACRVVSGGVTSGSGDARVSRPGWVVRLDDGRELATGITADALDSDESIRPLIVDWYDEEKAAGRL